jgi:hypothetical protein
VRADWIIERDELQYIRRIWDDIACMAGSDRCLLKNCACPVFVVGMVFRDKSCTYSEENATQKTPIPTVLQTDLLFFSLFPPFLFLQEKKNYPKE